MWRIRSITTIALALGALAPAGLGDELNDAFFARFARHVRELDGLDPAARDLILTAIAERDADTDDPSLMVEALVLRSPAFRAALDAYDEENYDACLAALAPIENSDDLYLSLHARAYAAKALVHLDRLVEAQERIAALLTDRATLAQFTFELPELHYMLGYCQVQNLEHQAAEATLESFLERFPDASPRFVVTAKQMLAELARRIPDGIGEVADLMNFSEQRLSAGDATDRVQIAQQRVIELLDNLIEQVEQQEQQQQQQQSSRDQQQNRQRQQDQLNPQPDNPMDESRTTPGRYEEGPKRPGRQVNPGEAWGAMPDAEREQILQVLRDRFPGRYRALVEQYYRNLAEQP